MGLKKIVMLTFGSVLLRDAHLYTLQIATKLLLQVVAVQDAGMIRMMGAQARGIRAAINAKLDEPHNWKGKKCRLHMEFSQDGTALKISTSNGDKAYCEAIKSAAHKAKFPAFNNPEVYRDFQKSGFDMRG